MDSVAEVSTRPLQARTVDLFNAILAPAMAGTCRHRADCWKSLLKARHNQTIGLSGLVGVVLPPVELVLLRQFRACIGLVFPLPIIAPPPQARA